MIPLDKFYAHSFNLFKNEFQTYNLWFFYRWKNLVFNLKIVHNCRDHFPWRLNLTFPQIPLSLGILLIVFFDLIVQGCNFIENLLFIDGSKYILFIKAILQEDVEPTYVAIEGRRWCRQRDNIIPNKFGIIHQSQNNQNSHQSEVINCFAVDVEHLEEGEYDLVCIFIVIVPVLTSSFFLILGEVSILL